MAESLLINSEIITQSNPPSDPSNGSVLFQRRVEFHPARKPFKGFNNGGTDFKLETLNPSSSFDPRHGGSGLNASNLSGKKSDASELLDFGWDPELSLDITFRRIGAGLANLGNTCFLNSVLQCLTYTEPLAAYLQSGKHRSSCKISGFCALCAIQNHVSQALQSTGTIRPNYLVSNLRCISRNFRTSRQEDAHEYMVNLLESMHKCCLPSGVPSESPSAYEKSLVHKIFGGRLRSQVKCHQCSFCSDKFDPFLDLSLEIFKADSLYKALANFTAAEWLDGGARQYQCQRCKQKVKALKQLTIHKAPNVLAIHLKRFHSHDYGRKIDKKIEFGCTLDLKPFVSGSYPEGDLKYSLYGVLVHDGYSTHCGHYYCYVRTSNNMWYTLDDVQVKHVSERKVLDQRAYMLFYVRNRRKVIPRKPVEIAQKENIKVDINGSRAPSILNQGLKGVVQNGQAQNRLNGAVSTVTESQKNLSGVSFWKDRQSNGLKLVESSKTEKECVSEPSRQAPLEKVLSAGLSIPNSEHECSLLVGQTRKDCSETQNQKNLVAPIGCNINGCNENGGSKENMGVSLSKVPTISDSPKPSSGNVTDNTPQKNDLVTKVVIVANGDSRKDMSDSNKNNQAGGSMAGFLCDQAKGVAYGMAVGEDALVSNVSEHKSSMVALDRKHSRKSNTRILKYQVSGMRFCSNFLFMASLGLRKKKHKRTKRHKLDVKNFNIEQLDKHVFSSDVGPSTSEETGLVGSCNLQRRTTKKKATKSVSKQNSDNMKPLKSSAKSLLKKTVDMEPRRRNDQNSATLATTKEIEEGSRRSSVVNKLEARRPDILHDGRRDHVHNNLKRSLEETVVARWDDIELPPCRSLESKNDEITSIGYVGDEWDEEYDRGRIKKLRKFKHSFGGPNPFQELATKESQSKRLKTDQSSSREPPFRI